MPTAMLDVANGMVMSCLKPWTVDFNVIVSSQSILALVVGGVGGVSAYYRRKCSDNGKDFLRKKIKVPSL